MPEYTPRRSPVPGRQYRVSPMSDGSLRITGRGRLLLPQPYDGPLPWAILLRDGLVSRIGSANTVPDADRSVDAGTALVTPGLVDAHTHPIFAGDRSDEAAARLAGQPYTEGGILRTVDATRATGDADLEALVEARLRASLAAGTTTIEAKSGYGLSLDEEVRHLRILQRVAARLPLRVVPTFLGAHAIPRDAQTAEDYAVAVVQEMLPVVAGERLAEFCDVFCDAGFFSLVDAERILVAAVGHGLRLRLHAEQLTRSGATELGVRLGATSVDHLEQLDAAGVQALAGSSTVATLLPGPALVMRGGLPPARALLDAGARVALASDANAGTFGTWGAMPLVIGLGGTTLQMTVAEALTAATAGGAASLGLDEERGTLRPGAPADLVIWDTEHEGAFALRLGAVRPLQVIAAGELVAP